MESHDYTPPEMIRTINFVATDDEDYNTVRLKGFSGRIIQDGNVFGRKVFENTYTSW